MTGQKPMKKILVVDDEEAIRSLYKMELEEAGYQVETAATGSQAIKTIDIFHPDLVTLDIRLPDMSGLKVLGEIRKKAPTLPVILCSAYGEYKQDLTSWGSDAYIVKSSDLGAFLKTVRQLVEEKG